MWKAEAERLRFEDGKSWTDIANSLAGYFPNKTEYQIRETIRTHLRKSERYQNNKQEIVGVIGDTHFPFAHPNYIHFLEETFQRYRVTRIIHVGDVCDNHAISRHLTEADADSAVTEFEAAQKDIEIYARAFPKVEVTLGNHCLIPARQCATLGIPQNFLKGFEELWNLPKGWKAKERVLIDRVVYEHGIGTAGKTGAIDKATNQMMSCVIGHSHSFAGVQYRSNAESLIFGMNVGCGIDIDKYAFRYGKYNKNREILGCGIVFNESNAIFVPMGAKWFRNK